MKCYRFKHLPTGMYYRPSSEVHVSIMNPDGTTKLSVFIKTNISKKGKVYPQKPSWSWIRGGYYNHIQAKQQIIDQNLSTTACYRLRTKLFPFIQSEWELEEIS